MVGQVLEAITFIEAPRGIIFRIHDHRGRGDGVAVLKNPVQCIEEQETAEMLSLIFLIDGQTTDQGGRKFRVTGHFSDYIFG